MLTVDQAKSLITNSRAGNRDSRGWTINPHDPLPEPGALVDDGARLATPEERVALDAGLAELRRSRIALPSSVGGVLLP